MFERGQLGQPPLPCVKARVRVGLWSRAVAQLGSALVSGTRGPGFKSLRPELAPRNMGYRRGDMGGQIPAARTQFLDSGYQRWKIGVD